ncbi:NAD(P)/FAD-dependent oxidoreductase [Kutzneria kofuensis]|uniref:FAD-dependent oxidoreductase n=1 Tax=Kutzneria kofuensis TaxID=103725 RepID=UPI0031ECD8BF
MEFTVVGAGMAGAFLALVLGRQGHTVTVYERRPDPRVSAVHTTSMNLGLSERGLKALDRLGLREEITRHVVPMRGRLVHGHDGSVRFSTYGRGGILAIQRHDLGILLIEAATRLPNVRFVFGTRCVAVDKDLPVADFVDDAGHAFTVTPDVIVGADGAFLRGTQAHAAGRAGRLPPGVPGVGLAGTAHPRRRRRPAPHGRRRVSTSGRAARP